MIERLTCIYGRPRTGTTSITGELNQSPTYCIWVEKDLWTRGSYSSLDELLSAAATPGGTSGMARRYNEDVVSKKQDYEVLGDKTTWMSEADQPDAFEQILDHISCTARTLGIDHEVVACLRDPRSWLAAWAMTHYLREVGADVEFWGGMVDDADVQSMLEREMDAYRAHLECVRAHARDPAVRVRCLERTQRGDFRYLFDFGEFIRWAAPPACREGTWPSRLGRIKVALEDRIRAGWLGTCTADGLYEEILSLHEPCLIEQSDGTVREV